MKKNTTTEKISIDLQSDMLSEIDTLANLCERNRSQQIRHLLEAALKEKREIAK